MTHNPQWTEIIWELLPGWVALDHPNLVAWVFQMKKNALLHNIYTKGIFSWVVVYIYTIEFQKHGLPHCHLLIFLAQESWMLTPEDIDSAISAQWPDPNTQPKLFDTLKWCMVHSPCSTMNQLAWCMDKGQCTKHFPKPFTDCTTLDDNSYPWYHCPDNGRSYQVGPHAVSNQWIVLYNPYLSAKYDCHINLESVVSFATIKYVFKYIHTGNTKI